ncbi:hypothetical protein C8R46DRAFT_1030358 [Mycena filopes]|nr:hypothetical protein C8R46DRAFT_1030358 [Mycena filopes]
MSTKSESSVLTNPTGPSAKPMTATSAPHPLLKSSRGRVLWPDQGAHTIRRATHDDDQATPPFNRTRERTSSITSIETIRLKVRARVADAVLKPKPPLGDAPTTTKRGTRKRTHSATSPEIDADDSGALQTGPRVRQRRDSSSPADAALTALDEKLRTVARAQMPIVGVSSALKRLRERFPPPAVEVSDAPRERRPSLSTKATSPLAHSAKTENPTSPTSPVAFPSNAADATAAAALDAEPALKGEPLQPISPNTKSKHKPIRRSIPGARLNKFDCYELGADEYDLAVIFPSSSRSNFEVWDQEDELFLVGPLSLHLTLKDSAKWDGLPVSHPDVYIQDLVCTSTAVVDSPSSSYPYVASKDKYSVEYSGAKMRVSVSATGNARDALPMPPIDIDPARGIAVDTLWARTYTPTGRGPGRRGWALAFYVPVATRLFERRETRVFRVEARVSVWGESLPLEVATMSVSHLMREREMVVRR